MTHRSADEMIRHCRDRGIDPNAHCCLDMGYAIAHPVEVEHQGNNRVLEWIPSWNEYRIPVAYDGYSSTLIHYCPFCGTKLPESTRVVPNVGVARLFRPG